MFVRVFGPKVVAFNELQFEACVLEQQQQLHGENMLSIESVAICARTLTHAHSAGQLSSDSHTKQQPDEENEEEKEQPLRWAMHLINEETAGHAESAGKGGEG
ncbi:hypothetical protein ACLKA7_010866 [Drosophila subpalustris]